MAKGQIAKDLVEKKIIAAFGADYVCTADKKIYVQALENKSADTKIKWMVFKLKYREMMLRELKAMRKAYNVRQRSLSATPDSFYDVMGSVIESNKAVTFKHLGTYNTISYYFKM